MNRKLYPRDTLFMAEHEPEGDGENEEEESGGGGDKPQSDIDKLRATKDAEIAALNQRLQALEQANEQQTKGNASRAARARALTTINNVKKEIDQLRATDPAKAAELALDRIDFIGSQYADSAGYSAEVEGLYRETLAESLANVIQYKNGGDVATYRKQLMTAKTQDEMRLMASKLELETAGRRRRNGNGSENGNRQAQPDGGRGSPARRNITSEMSSIDITTPEGRKQWEEKRNGFRKELQTAR